jgi:hypothetical protein
VKSRWPCPAQSATVAAASAGRTGRAGKGQ